VLLVVGLENVLMPVGLNSVLMLARLESVLMLVVWGSNCGLLVVGLRAKCVARPSSTLELSSPQWHPFWVVIVNALAGLWTQYLVSGRMILEHDVSCANISGGGELDAILGHRNDDCTQNNGLVKR
jgi:hypothetical protein